MKRKNKSEKKKKKCLDKRATVEKEWSTIIIQIDQKVRHSKMNQSIETE